MFLHTAQPKCHHIIYNNKIQQATLWNWSASDRIMALRTVAMKCKYDVVCVKCGEGMEFRFTARKMTNCIKFDSSKPNTLTYHPVQLDSVLVIETDLWNCFTAFFWFRWFLSSIFRRIVRNTRNSTMTNFADPCYKWSQKLVLDLWSCSSKCMICRWMHSEPIPIELPNDACQCFA